MSIGSNLLAKSFPIPLVLSIALLALAAFAQDGEKVEIETKYDKIENKTSSELKPLTVWGAYYDRLQMGAIAMRPGDLQERRQPDQVALFFLSLTKERSPLGEASLIVLVDGERLRLSPAKVLLRKNPIGSVIKEEMLVGIGWNDLRRIANARSVEMRLGHTEFSLGAQHFEGLKGMIKAIFPFEILSGNSSQAQMNRSAEDTNPALNERAVKRVQPNYPSIAKQAKIQGTVEVRVVVSEDGKVMEAAAVEGHPLLRNAAIEAAKMWEFVPYRANGKPMKVEGTLSFNFTLQ